MCNNTNSMLILGNGFDLANGYKTKYSDFYNSNYFRECIKNSNNLSMYIEKKANENSLWRDLEYALFEYSRWLTSKNGENCISESKKFEDDFNNLRDALFNYIDETQGMSVDEDNRYLIKRLYESWIKLKPQILSFNYSTISAAMKADSRIYNYPSNSFNQDYFIPQHGCIYLPNKYANASSNAIVLGIDDSQKVEDSHSFLYKRNQNIGNVNFLFSEFRKKEIFIIYGCSMGDSDKTYFENLFNQTGKKILVYAFNEEESERHREKIISFNEDAFKLNKIERLILNIPPYDSVIKQTNDFVDNELKLSCKNAYHCSSYKSK